MSEPGDFRRPHRRQVLAGFAATGAAVAFAAATGNAAALVVAPETSDVSPEARAGHATHYVFASDPRAGKDGFRVLPG